MYETYKTLFHANLDCSLIDLRNPRLHYPILLIPGCCLMDQEMADTIKDRLRRGATVIMTAFSAKVNEHNQVFDTPLPGMLSEVFGIRVRGFDRAVTHVASVNEGCLKKEDHPVKRNDVRILYGGEDVGVDVNYHEYLELTTAHALAQYSSFPEQYSAAVTCNSYGAGKAIYIGIPAAEKLIQKLLYEFYRPDPLTPVFPSGIVARKLEQDAMLLINTISHAVTVSASGSGLLSGKIFTDSIVMEPYGAEVFCGFATH